MTAVINYVSTDWAEHQEHLRNDPEQESFYSDLHREYADRIRPMWTSLLQTPMFEVKMEILGAPRSGVHRTVARVIEHVQAKEWMPPLSPADRDTHRKL